MPFNRGKFGPSGSKPADKPKSQMSGGSGKPSTEEKPKQDEQHSQHGNEPQHVTKTHPGETQPHPVTGAHAFQAHHTGGGKFKSHTHHDGGEVETREHNNVDEMQKAGSEVFPPENGGTGDEPEGGQDFSAELGGVGAADNSGSY